MTLRCIGEPLSWLRLERYHLGELGDGDRAEATEHLARCRACAACLARIEVDEARVLPPLEMGQATARARRARHIVAAAAGAVSVAAAVLLVMGHTWRSGEVRREAELAAGGRVKGGGVAFALVRDDGAWIAGTAGAFHAGERFKAVVTCPPETHPTFDLVVFDASGASFPLEPARELSCGNDVPLPGAFRLTGHAEERVCVVWSDEGDVNRALVSGGGEGALGTHALCKALTSLRRGPIP